MTRASAALAIALAVGAASCAQVLGLDPTERRDGGGVCAVELPNCAAGADRTLCGQLVLPSGAPFAVPGATGATTCAPGATDGPCAFSVQAMTTSELFSTPMAPVTATVDDCGRFRVEGVVGERLAVVATPVAPADTLYKRSARVILMTPTGPVEDIAVPIVSLAQLTIWETEMMAAAGVLPQGFLVNTRISSSPSADVALRVNGAPLAAVPTVPFAVYFAGATPYGTLADPAGLRTTTGPSGTAVLVRGTDATPFTLGGAKGGSTCIDVQGLAHVLDTFVSVDLTDC